VRNLLPRGGAGATLGRDDHTPQVVRAASDSDHSSPEATRGPAALHEVRVLVVEDEPGIRDFVTRGLENAGFVVEAAADGIEGERLASGESFDVIVLDLMLPGRSGLDILDTLGRLRPNVPVIALTAKGRVSDRVRGLEAGAADYLVKPFALPELVARVQTQVRASSRGSERFLTADGIELDQLSRRASRNGTAVTLSAKEFDLLAYMVRNRGRALSRREILASVWGHSHDTETNNVDVYIGYLRRKLGKRGDPTPIHTIRGVGYRLGEPLA
jgi:DNA-binding response OmpR family regulator